MGKSESVEDVVDTMTITYTITIPQKESMNECVRIQTFKINAKRVADSAGKTESEICSPQDLTVYRCRRDG
jgi:hypothetical protein